MARISGIARISVDGELLESLPGAELELGGKERELKSGHRVYGHTEKVVPSMLKCTIVWKNETPLETLRNLVDGLIIFESDNGKSYQMANAVILKPPTVKDENGEVPREFGGDPAEEACCLTNAV